MPKTTVLIEDETSAFTADVHCSLKLEPRQLPARYLYDALGSALFAAICRLPWYHVTRAEVALLQSHAREILYDSGRLARIVELGPGPGDKLAALLESGYDPRDPLEVHFVAGFDIAHQWVDRERGFALTLARANAILNF